MCVHVCVFGGIRCEGEYIGFCQPSIEYVCVCVRVRERDTGKEKGKGEKYEQ